MGTILNIYTSKMYNYSNGLFFDDVYILRFENLYIYDVYIFKIVPGFFER